MNIPCDNPCVRCPDGLDPDQPFVNLSAEGPDANRFIGKNWNWDPPPLGENWYASGCLGLCVSDVSQEEANLCAMRQAMECISVPRDNGGGDGDTGPRQLFGNTPQSCTFICPDGTPSTFVTPAGTFLDFNLATANAQAHSYACNASVSNRICIGDLTPARACSGVYYAGQVIVTAANGPVTFNTFDDMPDGIVMTTGPTTAFFSGFPSVTGNHPVTLFVTDAAGNISQREIMFSFFGIETTLLPDATEDQPYVTTLIYAGLPLVGSPVVWAVSTGSLPAGMVLDSSTGEISGIPTTVDIASFTVSVTNGTLTCYRQLTLAVVGESCPNWSTLVWGVPVLTSVSSFAPSASPSASWSATAFAISPGDNESASNVALLNYSGGGCDCNLEIFFTTPGALSPATCVIKKQGSADPAFATVSNQVLGGGTHQVPFNLTAGTYVIEVTVLCTSNGNDFSGLNICNGTLSNLP
jgi:hypothetical protein